MTQTTGIDRQSKAEPDYATMTDGRIVAAPTGEDDEGPSIRYGQNGHGPATENVYEAFRWQTTANINGFSWQTQTPSAHSTFAARTDSQTPSKSL